MHIFRGALQFMKAYALLLTIDKPVLVAMVLPPKDCAVLARPLIIKESNERHACRCFDVGLLIIHPPSA